ncbi:AAA family ATPase [Actinacidiphila yeochonensis]|uniref:AAA family ATPase n=1 Tax=Actinacidiphila yeochonensis TaxID=89050 RepID=UPI000A8C1BA6|nr:ATP-binding protein [Actinacidiphila yeochonensis]
MDDRAPVDVAQHRTRAGRSPGSPTSPTSSISPGSLAFPGLHGPGLAAEPPDAADPATPARAADAAVRLLARHRGLLVHGPAGIGKSTLLASVAARAQEEGVLVLRCSPAAQDADLPFVGVVDLFARVPGRVVDGLPPGLRAALPTALLDGPGPAGRPDALAVRVAVLEVLRRLAAYTPVLVAVDGLQWLDPSSADVLAFAARRIEDVDVRVVAALRVAEGERPGVPALCPPGSALLGVPPLPDAEVAALLPAGGPSGPVLRAVLRIAAGNPYYAQELARAAPRDGLSAEAGGRLPVPGGLRAVVLERVAGLPAAVRQALLVAAAAARPDVPLLRAAGVRGPDGALEEAEQAGVLAVDTAQQVRFTHPLLAAAVYADADERERRSVHARLARVAKEPVAAARHLALARPGEDAGVATELMAAARAARERGEPGAAAELAAMAVRRTPARRPAERDRRLLAAAGFACDAGRWEDAERAARAVLAESAAARDRVHARLVLLRTAGQALGDRGELIDEALREAGEAPELQAPLYHWSAVRGLLTGALGEAELHALRAARCAERAGDRGLRVSALATLARVRALSGSGEAAERALAQAAALAGDGPRSRGLTRMRAVLALDADRVGEALRQLTGLLAATGEGDGVESTVASLVALTRAQVRAGACREALLTAGRCTRVAAEAGMESAPALYAAALAETVGGSPARARQAALRAVRAAEEDGDQLFLPRALAALAQAGLFGGDRAGVAEAAEVLRRAVRIGVAMGAADPPLLGWYADLAEALVALGESAVAREVLDEAHGRAGRLPGSARAALERAEGCWRRPRAGRRRAWRCCGWRWSGCGRWSCRWTWCGR